MQRPLRGVFLTVLLNLATAPFAAAQQTASPSISAPSKNAAASPPAPLPAGARKAWPIRSQTHQVALIESYTTQESASGIAVDALVNRIVAETGADKAVALEFHVSYWPHLGWTDPFAHEYHKDRLNFLAGKNELDAPTAPLLFVNGNFVWHAEKAIRREILQSNLRPPPVTISGRVEERDPGGDIIEAIFEVDRSRTQAALWEPCEVFVVLFERGVETRISGGENGGQTITSGNVVRTVALPHEMTEEEPFIHGGQPFRFERGWRRQNLGVAIFVQVKFNHTIIQAAAVVLDPASAVAAPE